MKQLVYMWIKMEVVFIPKKKILQTCFMIYMCSEYLFLVVKVKQDKYMQVSGILMLAAPAQIENHDCEFYGALMMYCS